MQTVAKGWKYLFCWLFCWSFPPNKLWNIKEYQPLSVLPKIGSSFPVAISSSEGLLLVSWINLKQCHVKPNLISFSAMLNYSYDVIWFAKFSGKLEFKVTRPCIHYSVQGMLIEFLVACKNLRNTWLKQVTKSQRLCKLTFNVLALATLNVVLIFKRYTGFEIWLQTGCSDEITKESSLVLSCWTMKLSDIFSRAVQITWCIKHFLCLLFLLMHAHAHLWHAHNLFC